MRICERERKVRSYRLLSLCRLPNAADNVPPRLFVFKTSLVNSLQVKMEGGMLPLKLLLSKLSSLRDAMFVKISGMDPDREFSDKAL